MFRFRECRENAGISQKAAALELGVKAPSISDWEAGRTNPTCEKLPRMAELYHVTVDELLGLANPPTADEDRLIRIFRRLNDAGQARLMEDAEDMAALGKWTQEGVAISG